MSVSPDRGWMGYRVGVEHFGHPSLLFTRQEWDLGGERYAGMSFLQLAQEIIKASRFEKEYRPGTLGVYEGGILHTTFKVYTPNPHEVPGEERRTGSGRTDLWVNMSLTPDNQLNDWGYSPLTDSTLLT